MGCIKIRLKLWQALRAKLPFKNKEASTKKHRIAPLDVAVKLAASRPALGTTLALLVAWSLWGAIKGPSDTWQVVLQDVSSIQAYFSDTLLLRQQATSCRNLCNRICGLMSRSEETERMIQSLSPKQRDEIRLSKHQVRADIAASLEMREDYLDKLSNAVAAGAGSLLFLILYSSGIVAWIFSGVPLHFSNEWQLVVNTATAFEITFMSMFLQNIRGQHDDHLDRVVKGIDVIDDDIDRRLRQRTDDNTPAIAAFSLPVADSRWHRIIDRYSRIIGGGVGVAVSAVVFVVWLSIGKTMKFDDNWFLIIGTYTGLAGFVDGFVMKNVDRRETALADQHFERLVVQDQKTFDLLGLEMPQTPEKTKRSIKLRISITVGRWCASTIATYSAVGVVVLLIVIASAMKWTETGQLLCNSPTMIVEGFLLVTLLQAHNMADSKKRIMYDDILKRRLVLEGHLAALDDSTRASPQDSTESVKGKVDIKQPAQVVVASHIV